MLKCQEWLDKHKDVDIFGTTISKWANVTGEMVKEWKEEWLVEDTKRKKKNETDMEEFKKAREALLKILNSYHHKNEIKYIKNIRYIRTPICGFFDFSGRIEQPYNKYKEDKIKADKEAAKLAAIVGLENEALVYLLKHNKVVGEDFSVANILDVANDVAFQLEANRLKTAGEYINFNGQNCDGPCEGWMPGEHRCQCGNRRVSFEADFGHSFKNPSVGAEAY